MGCTTTGLAHFLGKKWSLVLLEEIRLGKFLGFNQVIKKAGMTPRILSSQLKEMEELGLINKLPSGKTSYQLTTKGLEFIKIIGEIKKFNIKWGNGEDGCLERSCLDCDKFN